MYDNTTLVDLKIGAVLRDFRELHPAIMVFSDRRLLCEASALAPGAMRKFQLEGREPILLVNVDGKFHAVDDECTHAIASLSKGRLEGTTVFCPMHGGSFDVCSGKARSLPCRQALRTWPLQVADGKVYLLLNS